MINKIVVVVVFSFLFVAVIYKCWKLESAESVEFDWNGFNAIINRIVNDYEVWDIGHWTLKSYPLVCFPNLFLTERERMRVNKNTSFRFVFCVYFDHLAIKILALAGDGVSYVCLYLWSSIRNKNHKQLILCASRVLSIVKALAVWCRHTTCTFWNQSVLCEPRQLA